MGLSIVIYFRMGIELDIESLKFLYKCYNGQLNFQNDPFLFLFLFLLFILKETLTNLLHCFINPGVELILHDMLLYDI